MGCEPAIPARDRPQKHTLDRAVAGIEGKYSFPAAIRTMISRRPVLSVVTVLTELTRLEQENEEFYNESLNII